MRDLRHAIRTFARTPGFSGVAILTLALGIGPSTAVFSVVNAVLLRPLPYEDADRVVRVYNHWEGTPRAAISPAEYFDYLDGSRAALMHFGVWSIFAANLTGGDAPERVSTAAVSAGVLPALGVRPQLGRVFTPDEDRPGGSVVLLSDGIWRRRFGGSPGVLGAPVVLNARTFAVIGVLPREFRLPNDFGLDTGAELYVPLALDGAVPARGSHFLAGVGRLAPGVTREQAASQLNAVAERFVQRHPDDYPRDMRFGVQLLPVHGDVVGAMRPVLLVLLGAVGCVLLIACANVASLMLTRADTRRREFAVRAALGAGRGRIARQLLVESLVLAGAGGLTGVLFAAWATSGFVAMQPQNIPRVQAVSMDPVVLAFAAAATLLTGLAFGVAPVLSWRGESYSVLRESSRGMTAGSGRRRFRRALIVVELALAVVLLSGAGLLLRSFVGLMRVDPGYRTENVLTVRLSLPAAEYPEDEQRRRFFAALVEGTRNLPRVSAAGAVSNLPLANSLGDLNVRIEGRPRREGEVSPRLDWQVITPGYFDAIGMRLVRGRDISTYDDAGSPGVIVLNETGARMLFPGEDALGKRFTLGGGAGPGMVTVVGIVGDVRHGSLGEPPVGEMYIPHSQFTFWNGGPAVATMSLVVHSVGDPASLIPALRREIAALDTDLPPGPFLTMEHVAAESVSRPRFIMTLLVVFSVIALLLATIGIYGVVAYTVSQRTHEMGIRIALGARRTQVIGLVLRQGLEMIGLGIGIGLIAALALTRTLSGLLFSVGPHDPLTLIAVSGALGTAALLACLVPARRATRTDPMTALRAE